MKAPLNWLRAYTDITLDSHTLSSDMTLSGSKVEAIEKQGAEIDKVVVAQCVSIAKHENSDHLFVCQVDIGEEVIQIVTGAQNVRENAYLPVALDGSTIAGGKKIVKGKLRGVESNGMMCSFEELGLDYKDYVGGINDGIMILDDIQDLAELDLSQTKGKSVMDILGASDTVIDFEITSNRADCFSMIGIAREVAATTSSAFNKPLIKVKEEGAKNASDYISVEIQAPDLCTRYAARVVTDVKIAPSPFWMKKRLMAAGVRSINNIVDITNYVMLEYGQPMHAFDMRTISGNKINVRRAADGEMITTLDGQKRVLDSNMLVIADKDKALAIAGVMGGENSEITNETPAIIFESAIFDGVTVRTGAKKLSLRTEASSRFEKGLDTVTCLDALNRAVQLVEELGAGTVCKGIVDCYPVAKKEREISFSPERINKFIGIGASTEEMVNILQKLECKIDIEKSIVIPPSFRDDLLIEADISEEIARFYGYNNIKSRLLTGCETTLGRRSRDQQIVDNIRNILIGFGFSEMLTFSFMSPNVFDKIRLPENDKLRNAVKILNPLGEDFSIMRTTMLPSVLETLKLNNSHRVPEATFFEIAYVYITEETILTRLPDHVQTICMGSYGKGDFFEFKGAVEGLLNCLNITDYEFEAVTDNQSMHPGRTAKLLIKGQEIGIFGQIHPETADEYEVPFDTFVAELKCVPIIEAAIDIPKNRELPKYPAVSRDIAVVVDTDVLAGHIEKVIKTRAGKNLESCKLFDVYQGAQVPSGKKSMAYAITFRDPEKTLTDEDVNKYMQKILNGLQTTFNAELRGTKPTE